MSSTSPESIAQSGDTSQRSLRSYGTSMTLDKDSFLGALGFEENPFTITNADDEPELPSYFVPPPYFPSVLGSPSKPQSTVVFAPRGGGKTAQKVMIENAAISQEDDRFLCITYDDFDLPADFVTADATTEWHLSNIVKKVVIALLIAVDDSSLRLKAPSQPDKNFLAKTAVTFLSKLTESEFRKNIESLRNWRGKIEHYWDKYGGKVGNLLTAIAARFKIGALDKLTDPAAQNRNSIAEYLRQLVRISHSLGYNSVYILVDRVDETRITSSNAGEAFNFVKDLLRDLHVLEMEGVAFKFFLWDQTRDLYYADGARPDRVPMHDLDWTASQISQMLSKRLKTFSQDRVPSLNQLFRREVVFDFHMLVSYLAAGSPRDMIRIAGRMVDEHTKTFDVASLISFSTAELAIRRYASERSKELYPQFFGELPKIGLAKFTLSGLHALSFRPSPNGLEQRIQKWLESGFVIPAGEVQSDDGKEERVFALSDPRLVIAAKSNHDRLTTILVDSFLVCPKCKELVINEKGFEIADCLNCGADVEDSEHLIVKLNLST